MIPATFFLQNMILFGMINDVRFILLAIEMSQIMFTTKFLLNK